MLFALSEAASADPSVGFSVLEAAFCWDASSVRLGSLLLEFFKILFFWFSPFSPELVGAVSEDEL